MPGRCPEVRIDKIYSFIYINSLRGVSKHFLLVSRLASPIIIILILYYASLLLVSTLCLSLSLFCSLSPFTTLTTGVRVRLLYSGVYFHFVPI